MTAADIGELFDDALTFVAGCETKFSSKAQFDEGTREWHGDEVPVSAQAVTLYPSVEQAAIACGQVPAERVSTVTGREHWVSPKRARRAMDAGVSLGQMAPWRDGHGYRAINFHVFRPGEDSPSARLTADNRQRACARQQLRAWRLGQWTYDLYPAGIAHGTYSEWWLESGIWLMGLDTCSQDESDAEETRMRQEGIMFHINTTLDVAARLAALDYVSSMWTVDLRYESSQVGAVRMLTDPLGAREVFALREIPNGKARRSAIRHWVRGHYRQSRVDPESRTFVTKHLRGVSRFNWNGLECTIRPALSELEQLARDTGKTLSEVLV